MSIRGWDRGRIAVFGMVAMLLGCELIGTGSLCAAQSACDWATGFAEFDFNGSVYSMVAFDDGRGEALFVGGDFWVAGDTPANRVARWDGMEWSTLLGARGIGTDARVDTLKGFIDNGAPAIFVGGIFEIAGGVVSHSIARWSCVSPPLVFADGFEWSDLRMWSDWNE